MKMTKSYTDFRNERLYVVIVSVLVGLLSELLPLPGVLIAEVIAFPKGVNQHYGFWFLTLALTINFFLFAGIAYFVLMHVDRDIEAAENKTPRKKVA
jgi:hypothetical protein